MKKKGIEVYQVTWGQFLQDIIYKQGIEMYNHIIPYLWNNDLLPILKCVSMYIHVYVVAVFHRHVEKNMEDTY